MKKVVKNNVTGATVKADENLVNNNLVPAPKPEAGIVPKRLAPLSFPHSFIKNCFTVYEKEVLPTKKLVAIENMVANLLKTKAVAEVYRALTTKQATEQQMKKGIMKLVKKWFEDFEDGLFEENKQKINPTNPVKKVEVEVPKMERTIIPAKPSKKELDEILLMAADDLNKVLHPVPRIEMVNTTNEILRGAIATAAKFVDPEEDKLAVLTIQTIKGLGVKLAKPSKKENIVPVVEKTKKEIIKEAKSEAKQAAIAKVTPTIEKINKKQITEGKVESNQELANRLLSENATEKQILAAFAKVYNAKGIVDPKFIKARADIYMKNAKKLQPLVKTTAEVKKVEVKKEAPVEMKRTIAPKGGNEALADTLLKAKASEKQILAAFAKVYKEKGIVDPKFIKARADIYMKNARKRAN